jgi:hypothetical protein
MSKLKIAWHNEKTNEFFTPKVRLVYPSLLEPEVNKKFPNNAPKFSAVAFVPKDADIAVIAAELNRIAAGLYGADWRAKAARIRVLR